MQEGLCLYRHWINLLPELVAQSVTHPTNSNSQDLPLIKIALHFKVMNIIKNIILSLQKEPLIYCNWWRCLFFNEDLEPVLTNPNPAVSH